MKPMGEEHFAILRRHMVEVIALQADLMSEEIGKSTLEERVLAAMLRLRRHLFVPPQLAALAYHDTPLPIGFDKTVSQPFICALMTDLLDPQPHEGVLEIGTGLGYQAAVLAELAHQVWTVEMVEEFASHAEARLRQLAWGNVFPSGWVATTPVGLGRARPLQQDPRRRLPPRHSQGLSLDHSPPEVAWSCPSAARGNPTAHRHRQNRRRADQDPTRDSGAVWDTGNGCLRITSWGRAGL